MWWLSGPTGTLVFETQGDEDGLQPAGTPERVILMRVLAAGVDPAFATANSGDVAGRVPVRPPAWLSPTAARGAFGSTAGLRYPRPAGRIRLVAYGARLESVLGESPRGFESPILRRSKGP